MPASHHRRPAASLFVALIPAVAMVGGLPFVNRLEPLVFGLPFLLAWILGWVVVTPVFLYVAYVASTEACATRSTEACATRSTEACATRSTEAGATRSTEAGPSAGGDPR
jgi:hypothetical protein